MKKFFSLALIAAMVFSLCSAVPAGATEASEVESDSMESIDLQAIMSRPVTQQIEAIPMDEMTPTGILCENANGLSRSNIGPNTSVRKGTPLFPEETSNGAYYYATSNYTTAYTQAFVNVKLPKPNSTDFNTLNGKRVAYISLGVQGYVGGGGVDIGLRNDGSGWYPAYGDVYAKYYYTFPHKMNSNDTNIQIGIAPLNATTIRVWMQGFNSAGQAQNDEFYQDITVAAGNFDMVGNVVRCRFYRFASLIPNGNQTSGISDGARMVGAEMLNCQLYNTSNQYVNWSIPSSLVANCWVVFPSKLTLAYTQNGDSFNIKYT